MTNLKTNAADFANIDEQFIAEARARKVSVKKLSRKVLDRIENAWDSKILEAVGMRIVESANQSLPKKEVKKAASDRPTKKSIAIDTYRDHLGEKRGVVIAAMMESADLTKAGAANYYQRCKTGNWRDLV